MLLVDELVELAPEEPDEDVEDDVDEDDEDDEDEEDEEDELEPLWLHAAGSITARNRGMTRGGMRIRGSQVAGAMTVPPPQRRHNPRKNPGHQPLASGVLSLRKRPSYWQWLAPASPPTTQLRPAPQVSADPALVVQGEPAVPTQTPLAHVPPRPAQLAPMG